MGNLGEDWQCDIILIRDMTAIVTSGEEVHELFKNLSDALDSLPSNLITELSESMWDDSLILLHAPTNYMH